MGWLFGFSMPAYGKVSRIHANIKPEGDAFEGALLIDEGLVRRECRCSRTIWAGSGGAGQHRAVHEDCPFPAVAQDQTRWHIRSFLPGNQAKTSLTTSPATTVGRSARPLCMYVTPKWSRPSAHI